MVAFIDLAKVEELRSEMQNVDQALENFAVGGAIVQMTISEGPVIQDPQAPATGRAVSIETLGMTYPPAMVETIKAILAERRVAIERQLAELGVTGVS